MFWLHKCNETTMIGYVYLSSGAIRTNNPLLYPARRDQLENLKFASEALGESAPKVLTEKQPKILNLDSLPKLNAALRHASRAQDRVVIDDFRRIFRKVPLRQRKPMMESLMGLGRAFWELRGEGRAFGSLKLPDLEELLDTMGPVSFRIQPRQPKRRDEGELRSQTANARAASISSRSSAADRIAQKLAEVKADLLKNSEGATLTAIADEANQRGITTTRGKRWSAATVKRALDRVNSVGLAD
jgi:hypothetical protein